MGRDGMTLGELLNRAADGDFEDGAADSARRRRKLMVIVATVAGAMLALEILLARMYPFFLGDVSAFVAIPVAMFGLSMGALVLHWTPGDSRPRWLPVLVPLLLLTALLSFLLFFALFNQVFALKHHYGQDVLGDAAKTTVLSLLFVPTFAIAGVILSTAFTAGARAVGRLYSLDLMGSAAACLATPLLLQAMDLPLVICALLGALVAANLAVFSGPRRQLAWVLGSCLAALSILAGFQLVFTEHPDPNVIAASYTKHNTAVELRHRWNAIARTAVIGLKKKGQDRITNYRLIHDDGISNVFIRRYRPERVSTAERRPITQAIPALLDEPPRSVLVIFAGCGRDMVDIHEYLGGDVRITGVELDPLSRALVARPRWDRWNLREFYALDHIDLVIAEGRGFLERDRHRYDMIFLGTNGAQHATRTGHSRKFLDTAEAMEAYLDHLTPGGTIVFNTQPFFHKIEIFKRLHAERGGDVPWTDTLLILGRKRYRARWMHKGVTTVVKPSGLSDGEIERIRHMWEVDGGRPTYWSRDFRRHEDLDAMVRRPPDPSIYVPTDDQPYDRMVDIAAFTLHPDREDLGNVTFAMSWIKVFTMVLFASLALLTIAAFYLRGRGPAAAGARRRLPAWLAGYFLLTGISYMVVQIGLMAKLELFLGNPLYAVAAVLAAYLLANGAGSAWIGGRQRRGVHTPAVLPAAAAALAVPLTLLLIDGGLVHLMALPVPLKAPIAVATLFPLGFALGMFYPIGVSLTVARTGHDQLVPMTFGLATLSSVLGSTYAIVMVINQGFRAVILLGAAGYLALALVAGAAWLLGRRRRAGASAAAHSCPS